MFDLGLNLTIQAVGRQLAAMPHDLYLVLIHGQTRRAFSGERLWTAAQLTYPATVRFLRARNREGCDVYIQPCAPQSNPGYILVDLDHNGPAILETMRHNGHEPCVVLHRIEQVAYHFWIERGCPLEPPDEDWLRAEQELRDGFPDGESPAATAVISRIAAA